MQTLNQTLFLEKYPPSKNRHAPIGVLQFGDGNFLRAFVDWLLDSANQHELMNAEVIMVQPLAEGILTKMKAQDHLFTVLLRGSDQDEPVASTRVVSCVKNTINPYEDWASLTFLAKDPTLRFVVSNTTEAGILYAKEPYEKGICPQSFPAKVTALLMARFDHFSGDPSRGLIFLPCELIDQNGKKLKACLLQHAKDWGCGEDFLAWLENACSFCDTLVDRIVTGFPSEEQDALMQKLGYRDALMVAAEPFFLWVIESPKPFPKDFPLQEAAKQVGAEVVLTNDLAAYRTRKVRILNGAHTATALTAYLSGLDTVKKMTENKTVLQFLNDIIFEEIVPFVPLPEIECQTYAKTIMARFANPFIRHELISIALNSVSKWQVRVLPTVKDFVAQHQKAPKKLAFSLAALLWFYRGQWSKDAYMGMREKEGGFVSFPIRDEIAILNIMNEAWNNSDTAAVRVQKLLSNTSLWGEDLNLIADLALCVTRSIKRIESVGIVVALNELIAKNKPDQNDS